MERPTHVRLKRANALFLSTVPDYHGYSEYRNICSSLPMGEMLRMLITTTNIVEKHEDKCNVPY
jgi:hypothetical protein